MTYIRVYKTMERSIHIYNDDDTLLTAITPEDTLELIGMLTDGLLTLGRAIERDASTEEHIPTSVWGHHE